VKLYLLSCGTLDADRAVIHPGDDSRRRVLLPVMSVLIRSEGKNVLVDTGMPPVAAGDPGGMAREYGWDGMWLRSRVAATERVDEQLRLLGLEPGDVDLVVNSHFHSDHAGGNALFEGVSIAAQEAELSVASESEHYLPVWDAPGLVFQPVSGDWSPAPGVEMLHTPGHTPGHQSMLVRLPERPWLFTFDAVYTEEHWRTGKLGAVKDVSQARASVERLRRTAEIEDARLVFGHDMAQWDALGMVESGGPRLVASSET